MYNVLIVEDSVEELELYSSALSQNANVNVDYVRTELEGIDLVSQKRFDAMIVDLKIGGGNGMKIVHEARLHGINRATPIYVISGFIDVLVKKIAQTFQVMDVVEKPIKHKSFIDGIIKRMLTKQVVFKYDANLINILVGSGLATFEHYFEQKPIVGRIRLKDNNSPARGFVTSIIDFKSETGSGSLALSANSRFIQNLAMILLRKGPGEKMNADEACDLMGEMSNQVIGRIKIDLSKRGANIEIGLPKVIIEKKPHGYHRTNKPIIFAPFGLDNYGCDIEFSINKGVLVVGEELDDQKPAQESGSVVLFD